MSGKQEGCGSVFRKSRAVFFGPLITIHLDTILDVTENGFHLRRV
ncbi:MAG: hypothetical protein QOD00_1448 [Blastocatellia bacterium]|jgi:hypothetical protein|nr:hypothetical protein [Blastocatellia bacterium]